MQSFLKSLLFLVFIFIIYPVSGQSELVYIKNPSVQLSTQYGYISDPGFNYQKLITGHVRSIQISCAFQDEKLVYLNRFFNFPETGYSFLFYDLGNSKQLGKLFGLLPYINFHGNLNHFFSLSVKSGIGLVYITKPFNVESNYHNVLIGSHFNALINLQAEANIKIVKQFYILPGIAYTHCSNGNTKLPNLGLNIPTASLGIKYFLKTEENNRPDTITVIPKKKWSVTFFSGIGFKDKSPFNNKVRQLIDCSIESSWLFYQIHGVGLAIDYSFDPTRAQKSFQTDVTFNPNLWGLRLLYAFEINKTTVQLSKGIYLGIHPVESYNLLSIRRLIYKFVYLNLSYKLYKGASDHINIGVAFKI